MAKMYFNIILIEGMKKELGNNKHDLYKKLEK